MNKFSTLATVAALALAAAAPVAAEEANVNADPFVSSQGVFGGIGPMWVPTLVVVSAITFAAIDSNSDTE